MSDYRPYYAKHWIGLLKNLGLKDIAVMVECCCCKERLHGTASLNGREYRCPHCGNKTVTAKMTKLYPAGCLLVFEEEPA
jgi:Zn finger protein HypA/HybF involved in hydrogenase expression